MTPQPQFSRRAVLCAAVAIACIGVNAAGALRYGVASFGDPRRPPRADVPGLSQAHIVSRLEALQRRNRPGIILSDASSTTVGKLEQTYSSPTPILFFADMGSRYSYANTARGPLGNITFGSASYRSRLHELIRRHTDLYQLRTFPSPQGGALDRFLFDQRISAALRHPDRLWFMTSPNPTLLNTWNSVKSYDVELVPWSSVHDRLALVSSQRGSAGIFDRPARSGTGTMLSRSEPDPLIPGTQAEAVGRYMLFDVVNPSPTIRLVIDFTATLNADGVSRIPPITVTGSRRFALDVAGRGAGRLISPPMSPRLTDGLPMIQIDMGTDGVTFAARKRNWLLALFGAQYRLDPRRLVGFVRDISVISEADYERARPPASIAVFPRDLRNPALQFSGFYEDGWVSERAMAWLSAPHGGRGSFVVRGSLPDLAAGENSVVHVRIDGSEVASQPILPGYFDLRADVRADGRRHKVELSFDRTFRLPNGDNRIASALLTLVGYE